VDKAQLIFFSKSIGAFLIWRSGGFLFVQLTYCTIYKSALLAYCKYKINTNIPSTVAHFYLHTVFLLYEITCNSGELFPVGVYDKLELAKTREGREASSGCWNWGEWGLKEYKWKGVSFLVGSLGLSCRYKRFLFCLGCSSQPSTKYFFLHCILLQPLCPRKQQAAQSAVLGRPSISMCLWPKQTHTCHN
jgi:hypothetical protein